MRLMRNSESIMFSCLLLFFCFALTAPADSCPTINEVHARDPEWVEIQNPSGDFLNLGMWNISDRSGTDSITCIYQNCSLETNETYFIVLGRKNKIGDVTNLTVPHFFVDDSLIGNGLNNDYDTLNFSGASCSEGMNYSGSSEGRTWSFCNGAWVETDHATPGSANDCHEHETAENVIISVFLNEIITLNSSYDDLFKIEIRGKENCSEDDVVTADYVVTYPHGNISIESFFTKIVGCSGYSGTGFWKPEETGIYEICGEIANSTSGNSDTSDDSACKNITVVEQPEITCNLSLSVNSPDVIPASGNSSAFYIVLNDTDCSQPGHAIGVGISYWIEDMFGNTLPQFPKHSTAEMGCVKVMERHWTPPDIEGSEAYYIKANITEPGCEDSSEHGNAAEKIIIVIGEESNPEKESSIKIFSSGTETGKNARFGDIVMVGVDAYRGDTDKYAVYLWVEGDGGKVISKKSRIHLHEKFRVYDMAVPVLILPDCGKKLGDGIYRIVAEGLGTGTGENLLISGHSQDSCRTSVITGSGSTGSAAKTGETGIGAENLTVIEILSYPENISVGGTMKIVVRIRNVFGRRENFTFYSYIFTGNRCVSTGFDGTSWKNLWDANKKTVELDPETSMDVWLENMIEEGTVAGVYSFRVRTKHGNRTYDATRQIKIEASPDIQRPKNPGPPIIPEIPKENTKNRTFSEGSTGMLPAENHGDWLSDVFGTFSSWLNVIFKFQH